MNQEALFDVSDYGFRWGEIWIRRNPRKCSAYEFRVAHSRTGLLETGWLPSPVELWYVHGTHRPPKRAVNFFTREYPGFDVVYMGTV